MTVPTSRLGSFFRELKRRHVIRVAMAYGAVSWVLVEIADTVFPHVGLPDRAITVVIALLLLGFPLALALSWVFELTREGVRHTGFSDGESEPAVAPAAGPPRLAYIALALPVVVAAVLLGSIMLRADRTAADAESAHPSLAVLPFANLGQKDSEDFSNGVAEDIRTQLGRLSDLRVIGRTSVSRYTHSDKSAWEIAEELGVSHVLEGTVQRSGDRLRITVRLVRAGPDEQLWSDRYDREAADIFDIQTDVAQRVALELVRALSAGDRERIGARTASSLEAYDVYLAGRAHLVRRDMAGLERAAQLLREATELDPTYAPAYVGLADAYILMNSWGALPVSEAAKPAREAAERALELDPDLGEAWTSLAYLHAWFYKDWAGAEERFRRAIELNPNYPTAHHWYAVVLSQLGRLDEAKVAIERAHALDPASRIILTIAGLRYHFARDPVAAREQHRRSLTLDPDYPLGYLWMAQSFAAEGRLEEALTYYLQAVELDPASSVMQGGLAYGLARVGDAPRAREILTRLEAQARTGSVPSYWLAQAYVGLGNHDAAFKALDRAAQEGSWVGNVFMEPLMDPLRDDPRWKRVLEAMRFPK